LGGDTLRHLTDEELTEAYYGEHSAAAEEHLLACVDCRANLARLEDLLGSVQRYIVPEPDTEFEERIWTLLSERLPNKRSWNFSFKPMVFAPALLGVLALVISFGWISIHRSHPAPGISPQAQARVLFDSLSEHLDRSEILLSEVANAKPGADALKNAQETARDLADENRLLRLASNRAGDVSREALLEDLERILVSVANASADVSADDLSTLQKRIDEQGLLFKVRITDDGLRREERKL